LSRRFFPRSNAISMEAHIPFRESKRTLLLAFATLQNSPAQQRQLLESNSVSPRQGQIRLNSERGTCPVCRNAFEREDTESRDFAESSQNELHLRRLHERVSFLAPRNLGSSMS